MAWTGVTSFETTDGSTSPTDGNNVTGTGDGTGWSGNWTDSATQFDYDNGVAGIPDGTWCMVNVVPSATDTTMTRVLTATTTAGRFQARFRCSNTDTENFHFQLMSGGTRACDYSALRNASGNRFVTDNNGYTSAASIAADTWYTIGMDYDTSTDTQNVYLDGVKLNGAALNFLTAVSTIDRIVLRNPGGAGSSFPVSFYVDKFEDGTPAAGGTYRRLGLLGVGQ